MYSKFLEGMTSKVAEQWATNLLTPAFIFWLGGLAAGISYYDWQPFKTWALQQPQALQVGLFILGLLVVVISAMLVQKFDRIMLRYLEGYWPKWMNPLRRARTRRYINQWQQNLQRWSELYSKGEDHLTLEEFDEYAQLDWLIVHSPTKPNQFMPTRLGNLLRASEFRSKERYGLDAVVCWPRLWLLIPDSSRKELQDARAALNTAARAWLWSLLFCGWALLAVYPFRLSALWPLPFGLLSAAFVYYFWVLDAARTYSDLIESIFDLYRTLLYQSLRWPLPASPKAERESGAALTQYLWRGSDATHPTFTDPK